MIAQVQKELNALPLAGPHFVLDRHVSVEARYAPEDNPFETVIVDLTHRCNMACRNCYIPNRNVPDLNKEWLYRILERLPQRTRIRLVGAEPTVRADLPGIIARVKRIGHWPILLTNGLKLANREYVAELKQSGLRLCYLSFNGGFTDAFYEQIDELACAERKCQALENLVDARLYVSLGIIVVRGINEPAVGDVFRYALQHDPIREIKVRSVGAMGRYMAGDSYSLKELIEVFREQTGVCSTDGYQTSESEYLCQFRSGRLKVQMTQWPELGSQVRGRLAPDGTIQPFFEHVIANEGGY